MEDILASIRETVEEEVGKAETSDGEKSLEATQASGDIPNGTEKTTIDDDIANELLSEDISDDEDESKSEEDALATLAAAQDNGDDSDDDISDDDIASMLAESDEEEDSDVKKLDTETPPQETVEASKSPAAEDAAKKETTTEDVLELTDVVEQGEGGSAAQDDLIDVNKFAQSGEILEANEGDVDASRKSYGADDSNEIDVDIDGIMNELEEEGEISSASELPSEEDATSFIAKNNLDKDETENTDDMMGESNDSDNSNASEVPQDNTTQAQAPVADDPIAKTVTQAAVHEVAQKVFLPTSPSAKGLQVSFPSEVLAEALRPLVSDWINQNLGDIVERLVKEEISKLVEK